MNFRAAFGVDLRGLLRPVVEYLEFKTAVADNGANVEPVVIITIGRNNVERGLNLLLVHAVIFVFNCFQLFGVGRVVVYVAGRAIIGVIGVVL